MRFVWLAFLFAACGDDGGKPGNMMIDAPAMIDAPLPACTGAIYDPCTVEAMTGSTECTSGTCKRFTGDNITVCTQSCTPGSACPMAGSTAVTCNMMSVCKPPSPSACTR